jgi:KDO2-lipid IV(A) lauroyltransferase
MRTVRSIPAGAEPLLTVDDLLWFLYLYPLRILSAISPRSLLYSIGRLSWFRARKRRDAAARRMLKAQCPGIPRDQIQRIAGKFLANSAIRMLDDLVVSWPSYERRLRCREIEGLDRLEQARSGGKGVILLTVHFCAIRIAKQHLASIGYPILTVRDEIAEGDWWGRLGRQTLAPRRMEFLQAIMGESVNVQDRGCVLKIVGRLRSGGLVNIHFDGLAGARTTPSIFLGAPRNFSTGIFDIVRLSGCAVVPMLCLGRSSDFRIVFGPAFDTVRVPGRDEFIEANLPAFVATMEQQILNHPEEWEQWMSI